MVEYGIEEKPPAGQSVALGLQHYLTMVGSNIAVPLVLAGAMGMPADATARLVGTFFVVSGVATLAQTTIGNRYPLVQGASFAILAPALAIVGVVASSGGGWETMIVELQGAMLVAGALQILIGYLGLFGYLKRFLSPVVIAPIIALIGLALFDVPQITDPSMQSIWLFGLTLVLIVGFSQYLSHTSRIFKLYPVLLGLVSAWLIAAVLSVAGVIPSDSSAFVDLSQATDTSLLQPIVPLQWGTPQFTPAFIVGIFAGVVASMIESFGDYYAVARISGEKAPSAGRINHGLGMEGIGNVFAGLMGTGNGSTSYSENIGAIGITGVASRYVVQVGAVIMLIAGYLGVVGGLVTTIPSPIVGGLFLVMFAQIIGVGLSQLQYVDLNENRNVFVIGITLLSGLSIPTYVENLAGDSGAAAIQEILVDVPVAGVVLGTELVAQTVFVVGTTGIAVGGVVGFLLDLTIPGSPESRGLTEWEDITEDDEEFEAAHERYLSGSTPKTGDD
ncbi:MAG: uracil-xanthine permease family protein [Halohasta sp.]